MDDCQVPPAAPAMPGGGAEAPRGSKPIRGADGAPALALQAARPALSTLAMAAPLLRAMRPHQWVKNLFVFVPLVFARKLFVPGELALAVEPVLLAAWTFVLFCVTSGAVYLLNDLVDRDKDILHPVKRHRPIASGRLPVPIARTALAVMLAGALVAAALQSLALAAVLLGYFALNVAYSFRLKHVVLLDISSIAAGFLLRILGGAIAIGVPVTVWLYACTFLLASYLALGKRKHELLQAGDGAEHQRRVLKDYSLALLDRALLLSGLAAAVCYTAYTLSTHAQAQFHTRGLVWTVPFIAFGLFRFARLVGRHDVDDSPTDAMVKDRLFVTNLAAWAVAVLFVVYGS